MLRRALLLLLLINLVSVSAQSDTLTVVSYNLLNFPDGRNDCSNNILVPNRADTLRKILQYVKPDIFVACEIQTKAGADSVLTRSLNVYGNTNYLSALYDPLNIDAPLNNQLYYNANKLTLQSQHVIQTSPRNIDHYVLYFNDPNLGTYYDTTFVEIYMCHLKAGSGSAEQNERALQTQALMQYISTRPQNRHHMVCGDLNTYTSSETCYQNLISGTFGLKDPINAPGSWNSNSSFAAIHTQSTRNGQNLDCGSQGGSDDRFDHILVSSNVMSGNDSLKYMPNSYKAIGNDGNHYNKSLIQTPINTAYPDSVVKALYYMSDHMPVMLKAVVNYPTSNGLALYPVVNGVNCHNGNDGSVTIVANDGQAPYTYEWDANTGGQTSATASGLISGSYCVQVTDNLGEVDNYCVFVPQPDSLAYSVFQVADNGNCSGEGHLIISGGIPPYTISWNDPASQSDLSAYNLCAGSYQVNVTDAASCSQIITVNISGGTNSIEEIFVSNFSIYPNPSTDVLNISIIDKSPFSFQLTDMQGREILCGKGFNSEMQLSLSELKKGTYFITVDVAESRETKKFIKL